MNKKIIGILSCNYSGSHFLSLMLGSHSCAAHVGELKNMIKPDSARCYVCGDNIKCRIFNGLAKIHRADLYAAIYERHDSSIEMLVDASKKPAWFKQFVNLPDYDLRFVHLIRDPRALLRRWLLTYDTPHKKRQQLFRQVRNAPWNIFRYHSDFEGLLLDKWLAANKKIDAFIKRSGRSYILTTYEAIAQHPQEEISRIMTWVGLPFEKEQVTYWRFEHHSTQKEDYEWIKKGQQAGHLDSRWKTFLSKEQIKKAEAHSGINNYLDSLGLKMGEEGLVNKS